MKFTFLLILKPFQMKKRNFGFTLIELLVVIVIIGILATISTATFKSYFGKARDAERQSGVQNIALMIKVDGADDWTNTKYVYALPADLTALMAANDFRVPAGKNDICYFIGMADGAKDGIGDDNEFVIATWGESTSTTETGTAGLLLDGTQAAMTALEGATLTVDDFGCTSAMTDVVTAFEGVDGTESYLFIDDNGVIDNDLTS
jgi:prepilin-type N-terminal cleavage/methylation domain-containing protein